MFGVYVWSVVGGKVESLLVKVTCDGDIVDNLISWFEINYGACKGFYMRVIRNRKEVYYSEGGLPVNASLFK